VGAQIKNFNAQPKFLTVKTQAQIAQVKIKSKSASANYAKI